MARALTLGLLPSLPLKPTLSLVDSLSLGLRFEPIHMFFRHHQLPTSCWPKRALVRVESFLGSGVDSTWLIKDG